MDDKIKVFFIPFRLTKFAIHVLERIRTNRLIDNKRPTQINEIPSDSAYIGKNGYKIASPSPAKAIIPLEIKAPLNRGLLINSRLL